MMASVSLKPAPFTVEKSAVKGIPSLSRYSSSSFKIVASGGKKIKTDKPYGHHLLLTQLPLHIRICMVVTYAPFDLQVSTVAWTW